MDSKVFIATIFFSIGIFLYFLAMLSWYISYQKKRYTSESNFCHLNNNDKIIIDSVTRSAEELKQELEIIKGDLWDIKLRLNLPVIRNFNNDD